MQLYTAQWCQPCKQLKQRLSKDGLITKDVTIIDIDESPELATGIRSIPCLKVDDVIVLGSGKIYTYLKGVVDASES